MYTNLLLTGGQQSLLSIVVQTTRCYGKWFKIYQALVRFFWSTLYTKSTLSVHMLYSYCPLLEGTHARSLPGHWSVASSKIDCSRPHRWAAVSIHPHYGFVSGRYDAAGQSTFAPTFWGNFCISFLAPYPFESCKFLTRTLSSSLNPIIIPRLN